MYYGAHWCFCYDDDDDDGVLPFTFLLPGITGHSPQADIAPLFECCLFIFAFQHFVCTTVTRMGQVKFGLI